MSRRWFKVATVFTAGKRGDPSDCEDLVAEGDHFVVLCDGATDVSGRRFKGKTGGRIASEIVCEAVSKADCDISAAALVDKINSRYLEVLGAQPEVIGIESSPTASFCAVEKHSGRVIRVGDTSWKTDKREYRGNKLIDESRAHTRAALLRCLLLAGYDEKELQESDPGWEMNRPLLAHQAACRNTLDAGDYSYGAIDGRSVPAQFVEEWELDESETAVVLASDGYPKCFMTLEECEDYLFEDLRSDPLRIGRHPSTKGLRPGDQSFDDRSFVRLEEL